MNSINNGGAYTVVARVAGGATSFPASGSGNLDMHASKYLGDFQFCETTGREDLIVRQLVVYVEGSLQANDINNWTLIDSEGNTIAMGLTEIPYVIFDLSDTYRIPKGICRSLTIRGTPVDGADRTLRLHIQNDYNLTVIGYNTGASIAPSSFSDQAASDGFWRIKEGSLEVNLAAGSPDGSIQPGTQEAVLAIFELQALGELLEIRKIDLEIVESSSVLADRLTGLVEIRSQDDSITYLQLSADTLHLQRISDIPDVSRFDLNHYILFAPRTKTTIKVVATPKITATSAQTYKAKIGNFSAWRASTKDFVDLLTSNYASGNTLTVQAPFFADINTIGYQSLNLPPLSRQLIINVCD